MKLNELDQSLKFAIAATSLLLFVEGVDPADGLSFMEARITNYFAAGFPFILTVIFVDIIHSNVEDFPFPRLLYIAGRVLFLVAAACTVIQLRALVAEVGTYTLTFLDFNIILCLLLIMTIVGVLAVHNRPKRADDEASQAADR